MDDEYKERIQPSNTIDYDKDTSDELESRYYKKTNFDRVKKASEILIFLNSFLWNFVICSS